MVAWFNGENESLNSHSLFDINIQSLLSSVEFIRSNKVFISFSIPTKLAEKLGTSSSSTGFGSQYTQRTANSIAGNLNKGGIDILNTYAKSVNQAELNIESEEIDINGFKESLPTTVSKEQLQIGFWADGHSKILDILTRWRNLIYDSRRKFLYYKEDYTADLIVQVFRPHNWEDDISNGGSAAYKTWLKTQSLAGGAARVGKTLLEMVGLPFVTASYNPLYKKGFMDLEINQDHQYHDIAHVFRYSGVYPKSVTGPTLDKSASSDLLQIPAVFDWTGKAMIALKSYGETPGNPTLSELSSKTDPVWKFDTK